MTDDPLLHSEMLNYNMIEKEVSLSLFHLPSTAILMKLQGTGHAVLAIRTRVSHEEHAAGGEVSMFDNEVSEAKIENDRELPTTVKSYETYGNTGMDPDLTINSRAFLDEHPANGEVTMTDNEALVDSKVIDEDLAAAVISYEAYGHTEQDRNPAPKPCSNSKHYTPKSFNEAITYLEKVQVRFPPSNRS